MQLFIENNWLTLVSILIGLFVSYAFYRLQRKDVVSAQEERLKHAHEELIDVIETYIINKQQLSDDAIENLVSASERSYKVRLRPECNPETLLQDVALRLQRSRHLDIAQKTEYAEKIEGVIHGIRESEEIAFSGFTDEGLLKKLQTLESFVTDENKDKAQEIIRSLPADLEFQRFSRSLDSKFLDVMPPILAGVVTVVSLISLSSLSGVRDSFERMAGKVFESPLTFLVPLAIVVAITVQLLIINRRIERRSEVDEVKK